MTLNQLRQRRGEIASQMEAILAGELTDEKRAEFDALETESVKIKGDILRAERLEEERAKLAQPVREPAKMDPKDKPGDPVIEMGADREAERPWAEGARGFGEFMLAVRSAAQPENAQTGRIDKRLLADRARQEKRAATGAGEAVPSDGGFLVQTDHAQTLLQRTIPQSSLLSRCTPFPISGNANSVEVPAVDEISRAEGSRYGGIKFYWVDEGSAPTATKPKFNNITLKLRKLAALVVGTDELVSDVAAFGTFLQTAYSREAAFRVDDAIINGGGAPGMLGIMNAGCLVSVSAESGQASTTIVAENIVKMWARLAPELSNDAVWLINTDCQPQLHTMGLSVGSGGQVVYLPPGGLSSAPYATLMGRPVLIMEQCQTLGTTGDIILAAPSQYLYAQKSGLQAAESLHVYFTTDQNCWRFIWRIDGQPWWKEAVTPAHGSNKVSPFIALASR